MSICPKQDFHMHFMLSGKPVDLVGVKAIFQSYKDNSITTIYDMGHRSGIGIVAKAIAKDYGITLKTCGMALSREGGYGAFLGLQLKERSDAIKAVQMLSQRGIDFVKVVNSGFVDISQFGKVTKGGFDLDILKAIVKEAKSLGLPVACHANSSHAIADAIEAGVDVIEHGYYIDYHLIEMMKAKAIAWTPTVYALYSQLNSVSSHQRIVLQRIIDTHLQMIEYAFSINLTMNVGTDSGLKGVEHGLSYVEEFNLIHGVKNFI